MFWRPPIFRRREKAQPLGPRGEDLAARFLKRLGYRIVKRNYHGLSGEIDIVAADGDMLVFVEVKTLTSDDAQHPEAAVNQHKRRRIIRAAKNFIAESRAEQVPARFDVVAIVAGENAQPEIPHFDNAFPAEATK
jgi:putative endonuclease